MFARGVSSYPLAHLVQHGSIPRLRLGMLMKTARPRLERQGQ